MKDETWTGREREKGIMNQYYDLTQDGMEDVPAAILSVGCVIASILHDFDHQINMGVSRSLKIGIMET